MSFEIKWRYGHGWTAFERKDEFGYIFFYNLWGNATCSDVMNSMFRLVSSHDSPPPPRAGSGGRRRTCLREMCWLKSVEVEDKKILGRKVSHYFGIYKWRIVFILNSIILYRDMFVEVNLILLLEPYLINFLIASIYQYCSDIKCRHSFEYYFPSFEWHCREFVTLVWGMGVSG